MAEDLEKKLVLFDQALLNNRHPDEELYFRFVSFLNKLPQEGGSVIKDELKKRPEEVNIILQAKNKVKDDMHFFNRSKEIDLPLNMVYVVAEGKKAKHSSMFLKGIVVERTNSKYRFAAMVYQELFRRMCFSFVGVGEDKKLFFIDDGAIVLRKGIASLMARKFLEESGFDKDVEEDVFNPDAESILNLFLQEVYLRNGFLEIEVVQRAFFSAVINGAAFPRALKAKISSAMGESVVVFE